MRRLFERASAGGQVFDGEFLEGGGDLLWHPDGSRVWAGYGFRSSEGGVRRFAQAMEARSIPVRPLQLIDERFYHLDTCFCPLDGGFVMYYPPAFDAESNRTIERHVPSDLRLAIDESDALHFACNAVNAGSTIIMNRCGSALRQRLQSIGFALVETELTEFLKAGGAAKCLTLRLNEPLRSGLAAKSA